ncbi:hypothetical protein HN512_02130 [Candidatus Peregrinibacteria bacterium]|jgi:hypothetical protein|nr:hypothetical protein [Candidatus Peregrinibacteria bacterium]MBT3598612.1 hypothetical protein [Candidatus Peregrinibacteria bacterium]MBT4367027.1 hypothetical protein [Candidatus Peregrinibacteria bacterium]MBT4586132.1 hypothetical protein [Candidatus Peregrinibacteria bacterium]MBT6730607.1 hypothetical protein [Candidatus Peregrinibacteria bacterium]
MKTLTIRTIGISFLTILPTVAIAQGLISADVVECSFATGMLSAECVPAFISYVIKFIFAMIGGIALVQIIISGYQIALAKTMGRDRSEGLTRLRVAIIGFILCAFSWYIVDFIVSSLAGI